MAAAGPEAFEGQLRSILNPEARRRPARAPRPRWLVPTAVAVVLVLGLGIPAFVFRSQAQSSQASLARSRATVASLNGQVSTLTTANTGLTGQVGTLTTQVSGLTGEVTSLTTQVSGLKSNNSALTSFGAGVSVLVTQLNTCVGNLESFIEVVGSGQPVSDSAISTIVAQCTTARSDANALQAQLGG
jgi:uncharacterized protein YoxC